MAFAARGKRLQEATGIEENWNGFSYRITRIMLNSPCFYGSYIFYIEIHSAPCFHRLGCCCTSSIRITKDDG
jgi:hypothetical protein